MLRTAHQMKAPASLWWGRLMAPLPLGLALAVLPTPLDRPVFAADPPREKSAAGSGGLVPLTLDLPKAAFVGTPPSDLQTNSYTEPYDPNKVRPPMMVPAGLKNLAPGSKLTCSATNTTAESLAKLTDGDKDAYDESVVYLRRGTQYVQMDLGSPHELFAIVIWHAHNVLKVYHDVVVQASDDPQFRQAVQTLFNNDQDNSSGLGVGTDREYFETREGKLIDAKGGKARYLRCYSRGSTNGALNEYTEIEVYGRPAQCRGVLKSVHAQSKAEIRGPKAERIPKSEVPNPPGPQRRGNPSVQAILGFRYSAFFRPSAFGFRISGLRPDFRAALGPQ